MKKNAQKGLILILTAASLTCFAAKPKPLTDEEPPPSYDIAKPSHDDVPSMTQTVRGPTAGEFPNPDSPDGFAARPPRTPLVPSRTTLESDSAPSEEAEPGHKAR